MSLRICSRQRSVGEVRDRIREDDFAARGESGRDAGEVLFRDADIEIAVGKALRERLEDGIAQVAGEQPEARVGGGQLAEGAGEGGPHGRASRSAAASSARAAASCSAFGDL